MKRYLLLSLLSLVYGLTAFAQVEIDGIYYNLNDDNKTAEVTRNGQGQYSGSVSIPESITYDNITFDVTSIRVETFSGCSGLTSISIGNSVTSIGNAAFSYCSGLTSITIPNSVTSIGDWAFNACSSLESITVASDNERYDSRDNCNAIIEKSSNTLIAGCKNTLIPNSVTSIGEYAFDGCTGLTSVTIPNSVTSMGENAFRGCSGLTSITIPNSVTSIGDGAFCYCSGLTSITIPNSVTSIGDGAFFTCSGLTSVSIGNSVTSIGDGAFSVCSSLESITVASDNELYDSRDNCNAIIEKSSNTLIAGCKNTLIPNSVTSIGWGAFLGCSGLTSITIPNSVTSIGEYAFCECSGLTSVSIGNSVTSIGIRAFSDCSAIEKVLCYAETVPVPSLGTGIFDSNAIVNATLYVPASALEDYKSDANWSGFGTILPMTEEQTPVKSVLDGDRIDASAPVFNMRGQRVDKNARGLLIVGGKKVMR